MTAAVAHFIAVKVLAIDTSPGLGFFTDPRHVSSVAVIRMEMVVDVSVEVFVSVKPRADADEYAVVKPFRTVIAGWRTSIRSNVIVTIRALGRYPDPDAHLSLCCRTSSQTDSYNSS
jgi:hypothetical protein